VSSYDAPNQQVVRADGSGPGATAGGNGNGGEPEPEPTVATMTKAQLLEYAAELGVDADDSMTKAEITEAIETDASA
jgi:hypothetical protein